ncbi:MAG: hypothetical protein LUG19_09640 [Desulfovibrio sp.]|uniref:lysozyme inhibitor LprI family protein n=1 Tax=Desulfovibrio sp. TaxID=885 RepID=UPI0025893A25|nr:lysozyme inhibitor LprI family protein [Desulfovibrio sp.]MCD7984495.1 hypothetical protein [Desulfovibrio sp.]
MLKYCAASAVPVPLLLALLLLAGFGSVPVAAADSGQTAPVAATPEVAPSASAPTTPDADEPSDDAAPDTAGNEGGDAENAAVVDRLLSRDYHLCMDAAAGVTVPMQDCMNAEVERLEKHLAERRARLVPMLSEERAKALNDTLDAWESLRKNGSAAMYDPEGGTLATVISALWYLEQTARMTRWLDDLEKSVSQQ